MYKYVLNSVVKISVTFAKYFEYYTIIVRRLFFCGHVVVVAFLMGRRWREMYSGHAHLSVCLSVCPRSRKKGHKTAVCVSVCVLLTEDVVQFRN